MPACAPAPRGFRRALVGRARVVRWQRAEVGFVQAETAVAAIGEVGAQAQLDAAEGEFGPRQVGFGEQLDGLAFFTRGVVWRTQSAAIEQMDLVDVRHVDHREEGVDVVTLAPSSVAAAPSTWAHFVVLARRPCQLAVVWREPGDVGERTLRVFGRDL